MTSERSDSDAAPELTLISAEELQRIRNYIRQRDECAARIGAAFLEFERLKQQLLTRIEKLLDAEQIAVAELAHRYGVGGERHRINLDTGEIERTD